MVGDLCGVHAQVATAAELSIGVRVETGRSQVRAALWERRVLVRTYGVRGTIHLFPARELPLWMAARRARAALRSAEDARRLREMGLGPGQLEELVAAAAEALDGRQLTLGELGAEIVARTGPWAAESANVAWVTGWPNWRRALGEAALRGLLCFGPNRGAQVTVVRPDQWLGDWQDVDPDAALRQVFKRYLATYGPASPAHFAQWFDLPVSAVKGLAGSLGEELDGVLVEGEPLLLPSGELRDEAEPSPQASVRLLPHFDCYLRGFHPRERLVAGHGERAAGGTGSFPVLLVEGRVAGVWERRQRGRRVEVRVDPFRRLGRPLQSLLEAEAARIGAFDGVPAELSIGPVEVRPHL